MTDKEKLLKLRKLADAMYYAAQYLTTDASRLHKAMDEYHQFIIHEYHKEEPTIPDIVDEHYWEMLGEEPMNEDLEKAIDKYLDNGMALRLDWKQCDITFKASRLIKFANYIAQWQKQQMMKEAMGAKITLLDGISYVSKDVLSQFKQGDKVKLIIIKEE